MKGIYYQGNISCEKKSYKVIFKQYNYCFHFLPISIVLYPTEYFRHQLQNFLEENILVNEIG